MNLKMPAFLRNPPQVTEPTFSAVAEVADSESPIVREVAEQVAATAVATLPPPSAGVLESFAQSKSPRDLISWVLDGSGSVISIDRDNLDAGVTVMADILHNDRITRYGSLMDIAEVSNSFRASGFSVPNELKEYRLGPPDSSPIYATIELALRRQDDLARLMGESGVATKQRVLAISTDAQFTDIPETRRRVLTEMVRKQRAGELQVFVIAFGEANVRDLKAMTVTGDVEYSVGGMTKVAARIAEIVRVASSTRSGERVSLPQDSDFRKL